MRFSFTDDQRLFADGLRDLLAKECTPAIVRAAWDDGSGHTPELWRHLDEMGVLGLLVPEASGGMGGDEVDAVLLWQALGRAAVPGPVLEHMCVGAVTLARSGTPKVTTAWLDGPYVPHATVAEVIVTRRGVIRDATIEPVESIDGGRRLAIVTGAAEPVDGFDGTAAALATERLTLAAAAVLVGIGEAMIEQGAEHARQRHQFGKPIGAFQAVKHLMADALLAVEFAKAPVYRAAWSLANDAPTSSTVRRDVSMAKALANEAARRAARNCMQVHGAMGYTWESDLHLWMKKAWALCSAHGDTRTHRRRVAAAVLANR